MDRIGGVVVGYNTTTRSLSPSLLASHTHLLRFPPLGGWWLWGGGTRAPAPRAPLVADTPARGGPTTTTTRRGRARAPPNHHHHHLDSRGRSSSTAAPIIQLHSKHAQKGPG